jgi:hypothetical protein
MSTKVFKVLPLQLFVEVELDVRTLIIVSPQDESGLFNVSESSVRSFVRALPKRDITVPAGQSRTLATHESLWRVLRCCPQPVADINLDDLGASSLFSQLIKPDIPQNREEPTLHVTVRSEPSHRLHGVQFHDILYRLLSVHPLHSRACGCEVSGCHGGGWGYGISVLSLSFGRAAGSLCAGCAGSMRSLGRRGICGCGVFASGACRGWRSAAGGPHRSPRQTASGIEARIVAMRQQRPDWGARKLAVLLERDGIRLPVITVHRVLVRHGLVLDQDRRHPATGRFERAPK